MKENKLAALLVRFAVAVAIVTITGVRGEDTVTARVHSINPHYGSFAGATRVYILGTGFSSSGNLGVAGEGDDLGNKVSFRSDSETVICDVENDASHETMIVCYTRPMKVNQAYYIQVTVDGVEVPFATNCFNNPRGWTCSFTPQHSLTAKIRYGYVEENGLQYPVQTALVPGGFITIGGTIFTAIFGSNDQINENGKTVSIRRVRFGGESCDLLAEPDVFYGLRMTGWDDGIVTCKPVTDFVGLNYISFLLNDGYGRAEVALNMTHINGKNMIYHFQTYAEITEVSPSKGSIQGGTRIVIEGRYFDETTEPIKVFVGGVPCEVVAGTLTTTTVECIAGDPPAQKDYYPGSRGVFVETWNETTSDIEEVRNFDDSRSTYQNPNVIDSTKFIWDDDYDDFVAKYTAVFVVPEDNKYKFMVAGDDRAALYIKCDGIHEALTKVAYTDHATSTYDSTHQVSDWTNLETGQLCYLEAVLIEEKVSGYLQVAVHRAATTFTAAQSFDAKNEVQSIQFDAQYKDETQVLNFANRSSEEGQVEVQSIVVETPCIDTGGCQIGFRLGYKGVTTRFIEADASESTVRAALEEILELSDEGISVTAEKLSEKMNYTVEFGMKRGDYSLLSYVKYPAYAENLTISIEEVTKGVSAQDSFKLRLGQRATSPISQIFDEADLNDALDGTRNAYCPEFMLPDYRKTTVVTTMDYEEKFNDWYSDDVADVEAFCGRKSRFNPDYIYFAGRTADNEFERHGAFDAFENRWLCLAHRGLIHEDFYLTGTFETDPSNFRTGVFTFKNPLQMHEDEWRYSCFDLIDEVVHLNEDFADVTKVVLSALRMPRKDKNHNYYIDALTIGSNKITEDFDGILGLRTPPALATGHPIKSIVVTKSDDAYTVKVETFNCGYQLPLITIVGASGDDELAVGQTFAGTEAMSGSFDLTVTLEEQDYVVEDILVDILAEDFEERLQSEVAGFGEAKVTLLGSCHAKIYLIEFVSNGGDKAELKIDTSNVVGASDLMVKIVTEQDGGILHNPMTGDMLRLAYDVPQVEVFVNGYPSRCVGNCQFETSDDATPIITSITPTSGSPADNTMIEITGTNLGTVGSTNSIVTIGDSNCEVTTNTAQSVVCEIQDGPIGTYNLLLNVGGKGLAKVESQAVSVAFTVTGSVSSISPDSGFKTGGAIVTITGYGFSESTVFTFDTAQCELISVTSTVANCRTPEHATAETVEVTASDSGTNLGMTSFTYTDADAEITSLSTSTATLNGGSNLTIDGVNIGQADAVVYIGSQLCETLESTTDQIVCKLPPAPVGDYEVKVAFEGRGYAASGVPDIRYVLQVDTVSPDTASRHGGNEITLTGSGFVKDSTMVKIGDAPCAITSITNTEIVCTSGRTTKVHQVTNNGWHPTYGDGFAWDVLVLNVEVGDTVSWIWEFNGAEGGTAWGARVFTTATADSDDYDGAGFQSDTEKSQEGRFSFTFTQEGIYYISTGYLDDDNWGNVVMKQSIYVGPSETMSHVVSVTIAEFEAAYNTGGGGARRRRSTCESMTIIPGCTPGAPTPEDGKFIITTDDCYSPEITAISATEGYKDTEIVISGNGFALDNCANQVIIGKGQMGEFTCSVTSSSNAEIKCTISPVDDTSIHVAYGVTVSVSGLGYSSSKIATDANRRFALLPSVSAISPAQGSLAGGTLLTISGSGFSFDTTVIFEYYACAVESFNFFEIHCRTGSAVSEDTFSAGVNMRGINVQCTGNCEFTYENASTPHVTNFSPTDNVTHGNIEITLTGTLLTSKTTVKFGTFDCDVSSSTETSITCIVGQLPAGPHPLVVLVPGLGNAMIDTSSASSIYSYPLITSMSPTDGSTEGGTVIEFQGNGFGCEDIKVQIGSSDCIVTTETLTNFLMECVTTAENAGSQAVTVTCGSESFATPSEFTHSEDRTPEITSISPTMGALGSEVTITGTLFDKDNMTVMIGSSECVITSGNADEITCTLGEHAGGEYPVTAIISPYGKVKSDVQFTYSFTITNLDPMTGSFAGGNLLTLDGTGFGSGSMVKVCDSFCEHGDDIEQTSSNYNQIICRITRMSGDASADKVCDVVVSINDQAVMKNDSYTFAIDRTPNVTSISPDRGGTQGGTSVTITGTLFDPDLNNVDVKIGGVKCDVTSSTATTIVCTTNAKGQSSLADIVVTIAGKGQALCDVQFYYIDVWSSTYTWGGQSPPVEGDFVVVPASQTLLVDQDTPVLKMILIQGGTIIFDEKDIHLQTENILIVDGGTLQIGTEDAPFQHKAIITLHGHLRSRELPIYGTKTIGVRNGTLDLHGKHVPYTWTLLDQTAESGTNILFLKDSVTWSVDDEIVIATTGHRHSQRENEKRKITAISDDGRQLTLDSPLNYTHISISEFIEGTGYTVETHAEVGLLTRNIVIQGSVHMEWSKDVIPACEAGFDTGEFATQTCFQGRFGAEEGSDQFGGQIMIHHRAPGLDIARARIEYVELTNVGQAFRLGRYPIHFHLLGDVNFKNYVRGCAIHKSFNRAITIHNTHHLLIENNVVYDVMGGAVFIEDGIEHGNKIEYNLVVFCKQSTSLQNDDVTPAAFWVTNPNNTLQHNAAAGGTHFGFWYRIRTTPDGPSADPTVCQQLHPIEKFYNNTVHSQGWFGLWVFKTYTPRGDGSCGSTEPAIAKLESMVVWNCEKGAELVNVGAVQFHDFVMVHNEKAGVETKQIVDGITWGQIGTYNSLIIAHTTGLSDGATSKGIILPFSEGYVVDNTMLVNFDRDSTAALGVTSVQGTCTNRCGGWEARFSNMIFVNSPNKAAFRWQHEVIFRDMDGTLSGTPNSLITPHNPTLPPNCRENEEFSAGDAPGVQCIGVKKFHRVAWNNPTPSSLEGKTVSLTTEYGNCTIPFLKKRITHKPGWMATVVDGETYEWVFENAGQITNTSYQSTFYNFESDECVIIKHNLTQTPDKIIIAGTNNQYRRTEVLSCENNFHGDYHFDNDTTMLTYIVSGSNRVFESNRKKRAVSAKSAASGAVNRNVNFRVYRCFYENCIAPPSLNNTPPAISRPDDFLYWNDSSHWSLENGEYHGLVLGDSSTPVPPDDQDIRIHREIWMVVFTDLPRMNRLWIEGVLEIDGNDPSYVVTLSATHIMIMGGRLIVGWEDSPFQGLANIVLRGNHHTPDIVFHGGVSVGSKAIGVLGGLDLHGKARTPTTTHLSSPLSVGENTITLEDTPLNWTIGDELVIASTGTDPWETETFKIVLIEENVITLNDTAKFNHLSENFTLGATGVSLDSYAIRAEVSILTRNVKVIGDDYSDLIPESFGARILVAGIGETRGYARISNVEFYHTGQEGWPDNYDPRYSLAFLNSGPNDDIRPSSVKQNVFHNGFNTAIGVFGASNLTVTENVIHHTVGPGIRIEGQDITVTNNLVMLTRTKTVYLDRNEIDILLWQAAIEVNLGGGIILSDNVVVGSERAGYRIDGHVCEQSADVEWGWNTARATLHGIWMNKDGYSPCTLINKFKIHNAYDAGIYYQGGGNVIISNVLITDSGIAIIPFIFGPASKSNLFQDKSVRIEHSTIVAISKQGFCPTLASSTDFLGNSGKARAPLKGNNRLQKIGILWPSFLSSQNKAPGKPFVGVNSYPAIGGKTEVTGVVFVNFGDTSCNADNIVFLTNANSEDFMHPIYASELDFENSPENTLLYFHRPSLGKINPADCVDMECDGLKKALFVDQDGCVVGGSGGTVIPQAEFEWGGDPRRGLGDYRIPKAMLTNLDGSRIPVEDIAPYKGILRATTETENCTTQDSWQAHKCTGYHHGILVIESMDADSETRRLSPLALLAESYIDLNNGPQDHGWCAGYTCQERLSTFWTIVAFSKTYDLYFTSTSPSRLRLRILNEESSTKMILKIFIKRPQRLDVFTNDYLTFPTNYENGVYSPPATPTQWHPTLVHPPGANYYDRDYQTIYITLAGGDNVIEIRESLVVMITFQLSVDTPDEFFDNGDLINHLVLFLDIPPAKIRIVNAVRESTGSRKKRNTGSVPITVEIGDSAEEVANAALTGNDTPDSLSRADLGGIAARITDKLQLNEIDDVVGTGVQSVIIMDTRQEPTRNVNFTDRVEESESVATDYFIPNTIRISQQPTTGFTDTALSPILTVVGVDADGNDIILGHSSNPWQATVTINSPTQSDAMLSGITANFSTTTGLAEFEDLMISHLGTYILTIQITYPSTQTGLIINTDTISIVEMSTVSSENNLVAILLGVIGGLCALGTVAAIVYKSFFFRSKKPYQVTPGDSPTPGNLCDDSGYSANPSSVNIVNEAFYVTPDESAGIA